MAGVTLCLDGVSTDSLLHCTSAVTLYNCSVGHADCSRCQTADPKYSCVWCGGEQPSCIFRESCREEVEDLCPAPLIHSVSNPCSVVCGSAGPRRVCPILQVGA